MRPGVFRRELRPCANTVKLVYLSRLPPSVIAENGRKRMKKTLMLVACMAMAVALTGCGGSPSAVAEDFVNAIIQKDVGTAIALYVPEFFQDVADRKQVKEDLERLSRRIDDTKREGHAILEVVSTPGKDNVIMSINGENNDDMF